MVRTDHRPAQSDIPAEVHVPGDCQVIQIHDFWDLLEAFLEFGDLWVRDMGTAGESVRMNVSDATEERRACDAPSCNGRRA